MASDASGSAAATAFPPGVAPSFLSIHAVRIFVRDLDRSLHFYVGQLGFRLVIDARLQSGERWVAVSPPDGTAILALVAPQPRSLEHKLIGRATHVVLITGDVAARFQEWSRKGVRFMSTPRLRRIKYEPAPAGAASSPRLLGEKTPVWGGVFARFRDIDGNTFSLVSFDEVTHTVETERRAAADKLETERRAVHELGIARQVQARLFPQSRPALASLDYAGACLPAQAVGGDYYDFLSLGPDRLGLVIGDVMGKGMAAALLMANLQANLRSQVAFALDEPRRLLETVNLLFCENSPESSFASLFYGDYHDRTGALRYVNCGHVCALVLRRDGTLDRLQATSTVLGLFRQWECSVGECRLEPDDLLALYTDGVTEAFDDTGEEFGEQRLVDALRRHGARPPESLLASLVEEVHSFSPHEQQDDLTLIVARRRSASRPGVA
ncbi:MAG TPA: SpoIIE family protein phosphatase [Vicinamibacteria bacterium]|jgi:serine phosphatase RsbU (regulator of sigma subunit)/catechol 2,3-dioxygenase-like lactoylglutathione lyase family enzyme|nr:SpoIIE family protein phosphatase [Vicinamibacteria bacterium]